MKILFEEKYSSAKFFIGTNIAMRHMNIFMKIRESFLCLMARYVHGTSEYFVVLLYVCVSIINKSLCYSYGFNNFTNNPE